MFSPDMKRVCEGAAQEYRRLADTCAADGRYVEALLFYALDASACRVSGDEVGYRRALLEKHKLEQTVAEDPEKCAAVAEQYEEIVDALQGFVAWMPAAGALRLCTDTTDSV